MLLVTIALNIKVMEMHFMQWQIRTMHSKDNNSEVIISNETDEITEKPFESLLQKYQKGLEESMKGREFVYDNLLHYKCHKISLNCGGSYIGSPKWLTNKKSNKKSKN